MFDTNDLAWAPPLVTATDCHLPTSTLSPVPSDQILCYPKSGPAMDLVSTLMRSQSAYCWHLR